MSATRRRIRAAWRDAGTTTPPHHRTLKLALSPALQGKGLIGQVQCIPSLDWSIGWVLRFSVYIFWYSSNLEKVAWLGGRRNIPRRYSSQENWFLFTVLSYIIIIVIYLYLIFETFSYYVTRNYYDVTRNYFNDAK